MYNTFKKYEVKCNSLKEFCEKYHRLNAWHNRTADYREADYLSHKEDMEKYGFTFIPKLDSITGGVVSYYGEYKV